MAPKTQVRSPTEGLAVPIPVTAAQLEEPEVVLALLVVHDDVIGRRDAMELIRCLLRRVLVWMVFESDCGGTRDGG